MTENYHITPTDSTMSHFSPVQIYMTNNENVLLFMPKLSKQYLLMIFSNN